MKKYIASLFVLVACTTVASALPIVSVGAVEDAGGGLERYTFSVAGGTPGEYGAFEISITPDAGLDFANPAAAEIFVPNSNETGFIGTGTVTAGFTFLGAERSASGLSGTFTSFGQDTATFAGAFGQVVGAAGLSGSGTFQFADGSGNIIGAATQTVFFGSAIIPEPSTAILAALGVVGFVARRRG